MGVTLSEVVKALEVFAPPGLSENWDRSGLQVGDPGAEVETVLAALDASPRAVAKAAELGAQLLLTHHPLLLSPLTRLDLSRFPDRLVAECVRRGIAVYSSHTNLDRAEGGVNDVLARRLGLVDLRPLGEGEEQAKVVVTVPVGYEGGVRRALAEAGGGRLGKYEGCAFSGRGTGAFRPLAGARPFAGQVGADTQADESRLEMVFPRSRVPHALEKLRGVHPYEQPAVDVIPVLGRSGHGALGRVGSLTRPVRLDAFAAHVARALCVADVRRVGDPETVVGSVAVCGGSGASLWPVARALGAQVLVTGDVKYHAAREAEEAGFALIDAGHGATEGGAVQLLADVVSAWAAETGQALRVETFWESGPLVTVGAPGRGEE